MENYLINTPSHELVENAGAEWQSLVSLGVVAREMGSNAQWLIADLAMSVINNFGPDSLDQYASEVGLKKDTMARYSRVSKAWPPEKRVKHLSFSHHMLLASREDRYEIIEKVADRDDMTTEKLSREIKKSDGGIDKDIVSARILMIRGDLETVMNWYRKILEKWPETLHDADHLMFERMRQHYKKMMELAKRESSDGVLDN